MHRLHEWNRVRRAVEKIGIAKRDVPRARRDLLTDILEDDLSIDHAKRAVIHRHDGAMAA